MRSRISKAMNRYNVCPKPTSVLILKQPELGLPVGEYFWSSSITAQNTIILGASWIYRLDNPVKNPRSSTPRYLRVSRAKSRELACGASKAHTAAHNADIALAPEQQEHIYITVSLNEIQYSVGDSILYSISSRMHKIWSYIAFLQLLHAKLIARIPFGHQKQKLTLIGISNLVCSRTVPSMFLLDILLIGLGMTKTHIKQMVISRKF